MNKTVMVDSRIYSKSKESLKSLGYEILELTSKDFFDKPVSAHPDMYIAKICDTLFADSSLNILCTLPNKVFYCDRGAAVSQILKYPFDIAFNCAQIGNNLLCNRKYTHHDIISYAESINLNIVDTNQGYAKCSTCVVSDNAIITEDDNIESVCRSIGIDVLKIKKGYVKLDGYDYGFIGGCCGLVEENLLVFNGCLELHPQATEIAEFCGRYGVNTVSLSDEALYDIGSIIRI